MQEQRAVLAAADMAGIMRHAWQWTQAARGSAGLLLGRRMGEGLFRRQGKRAARTGEVLGGVLGKLSEFESVPISIAVADDS